MSQQFNYYLGRLNDLSDKRVSNQFKMIVYFVCLVRCDICDVQGNESKLF